MSQDKSSYAVLAPLKLGGKRLDPIEGKVVLVELTEDEAAELKALGVVGDAPAKPEKVTKPAKPEKPEGGEKEGGADQTKA